MKNKEDEFETKIENKVDQPDNKGTDARPKEIEIAPRYKDGGRGNRRPYTARYIKSHVEQHISSDFKRTPNEKSNADRFGQKTTLISERPETDKYEEEASKGNFGEPFRGGYQSRGRYQENR